MLSKKNLSLIRPLKWLHFINEVHPIFPNIICNCIGFSAFYVFVNNFLALGVFSWTDLIVGASTYAAARLGIRALDELKDQETDIFNFPDRPLIKGTVVRSDLFVLCSLVFSVPLALHLLVYKFSLPTLIFALVTVFSLLSYKWFYIKGILNGSTTLSFLLHSPLPYLFRFYILSFSIINFSELFRWQNLILIFTFTLTETAWEVARKVRQKREETEYSTYTQAWGQHFSAYFILSLLYTSAGLLLYILREPMLAGDKIIIAIFVLPICSLAYLTIHMKMFMKGKTRGSLVQKQVEFFAAAFTLSTLALGCLKIITHN